MRRRRWLLLNHDWWSRANQPCGIPCQIFSLTCPWLYFIRVTSQQSLMYSLRNKNISSWIFKIDLKTTKAVRVTRQVVHGNTLRQILMSLIPCLPIERRFHVMRQIDSSIGARAHTVEGREKFFLMYPDRNVSSIELVQSSRMIKVQVALIFRQDQLSYRCKWLQHLR